YRQRRDPTQSGTESSLCVPASCCYFNISRTDPAGRQLTTGTTGRLSCAERAKRPSKPGDTLSSRNKLTQRHRYGLAWEQALSRNDLIIRSFCVQVGLVGMDRTLFKLSVEIPQGGSYRPSGAVMAKWGLACDVACHPPKRVKI